ncbi:MAG TPA: PTS sugar transporter subunit IIC [Anaeromyxobacteraceae bacterium]|nr:PTS sugar transporter subunit IIC [Anaeromyxobacteraceae bacterium]
MSYLALGLVAGLAAVERKGFLQAMLSRPIALAPLAGLAVGDAAGGLFVAAPLELLWLGAVNLGAAVPVHEALGTAAIAAGTVLALRGLDGAGLAGPALLPAVAALAVVLCAPLALVGRRADRLVERLNERLHARAEADLAEGNLDGAARMNLYGLGLPFAISFVLAPLGAALAAALIPPLVARVPAALPPLAVGWAAFAGFACAAGAKALRAAQVRRHYLGAFAAGLASLAILTGLGVGVGR